MKLREVFSADSYEIFRSYCTCLVLFLKLNHEIGSAVLSLTSFFYIVDLYDIL